MAGRSLDTGEFNEYGDWKSYHGNNVRSGPSPIPLLVLAVLIAMIMLLRPEGERRPVTPRASAESPRQNW
jgi:hypothetical protein